MTIRIERATIIGVGLLGASLGLALKERALAKHVTGVGRRRESLDIAMQRGAIDAATMEVKEGVSQADLVVIATPALQVIPILDAALADAPAGAILLDVASVKKAICDHANKHCPQPRRFVGCHPMAGGEKFGPTYGNADFYVGSVCLVEEDEAIDAQVHETVCALWRAVGARVTPINAADHDAMLARTSHTPHVTATAVARLAADFGATGDFVGKGFVDFTRIAASRPEIWRDICLENSAALADAIAELRTALEDVEKLLADNDAAALEAFFRKGVQARHGIINS